MSLTRAKWEDMWKSAKKIEDCSKDIMMGHLTEVSNSLRLQIIDREINHIKQQIQSVIGQME